MTMTTEITPETAIPSGPLHQFIPRTLPTKAKEALRGATTAANWLPSAEDVPELADTVEAHARLRTDLARTGLALQEAEIDWRREDAGRTQALTQAARNGHEVVLKADDDGRTPEDERVAVREAAHERMTAVSLALASVVNEAIEIIKAHEAALVARERDAHAEAADERRELLRRVAEIDAGAWSAAMRARWLKQTAGSRSGFDREPWPQPSPPPRNLDRRVIRDALAEPTRRAA